MANATTAFAAKAGGEKRERLPILVCMGVWVAAAAVLWALLLAPFLF